MYIYYIIIHYNYYNLLYIIIIYYIVTKCLNTLSNKTPFTCSVTFIKVGCVFLWNFNCRDFCSMLYYILSVEVKSTCTIGVISSFRNISGVLCCNLLFPEMYKNLRNLDVQNVMTKIAKKYCSLLSEKVLIETHDHSWVAE